MFKQVFSGIAQRVVLKNHVELEKLKRTLPKQTTVEVAEILHELNQRLIDPAIKSLYDDNLITLPEGM